MMKQRVEREEYRLNYAARRTAQRLGWFSIGLGVVQVAMPGVLARTLGIPRGKGLMRLCGLREIATGVGLLMTNDPKPWVQARVGGDALDLGLLATAMLLGNKPLHAAIAAGTVASVTAADVCCERGLEAEDHPVTVYDYSDRSGFPDTPDAMRGKAASHGSMKNVPQVAGMAAAERESETRH
jgi:hypothetical protein